MRDITPTTKKLLPKLELALDTGLRLLLGLPKQFEVKPLNLKKTMSVCYKTEATIKGPDLEFLDKDVIPARDMQFSPIGFKPGAQGFKIDDVVETIDSRFTFNDILDYRNDSTGLRFEEFRPHEVDE
jgi:hypothetical protein